MVMGYGKTVVSTPAGRSNKIPLETEFFTGEHALHILLNETLLHREELRENTFDKWKYGSSVVKPARIWKLEVGFWKSAGPRSIPCAA